MLITFRVYYIKVFYNCSVSSVDLRMSTRNTTKAWILLHSTPDNSHLLGKSKEVWVIGFSSNSTGNEEKSKWDGKEIHAHLTSTAARDLYIGWYFEKRIKQKGLINTQGWTLYLNWTGKKQGQSFEINSMFRTAIHCFFFYLSRA